MKHAKAYLGAVGAIALAASTFAHAQGTDSTYGRWDDSSSSRPSSWIPMTSHGYLGLSLGESNYDLNCAAGFSCDEKDVGGKLYVGGQFNRIFGVELAYVHLGQADANGGSTKVQLANLSLVGNVPIGEQFSVYGKVGGFYGWTDIDTTAPGAATGEENDLGVSYGAGVQFDLNRNWAVTGDWDHYRVDYVDRQDDVQLWSVGVRYKF
jgi:OOP family OmpA-OmpF porin